MASTGMESTEEQTSGRASRLRLQQFLPVHDSHDQQLLGRVVDLSLTGLMLIATRELPVGEILSLEIRSPAELDLPSLVISAETVWCRNNPNNPSHFGVGFRFKSVTEDARTLLEKLMQQPGIVH